MEYIMANLWIAWIIVGIFFLIVELCTTALVSIWFVPAAVITCFVSLVVDSFLIQTVIFLVLSVIFMMIFRNIYKKYIKKPVDDVDPCEQTVGKVGIATENCDANSGKVLLGDIYWKAATENGEIINQGEKVIIAGVKGTTLIIKKENSD